MQTGGRILGQGVFGCTLKPVPRCAGGDVFEKIGKLPAVAKVTTEDARDELEVGRAIMDLPLASQYFALPTEMCKPEMPIDDPEATECRVIKNQSEGAKFSMLIMPAAGQQLLKYGLNMTDLSNNYTRILTHLLEGAVIYQNAGYVHNDIHMGNILVDAEGVARYIDFGLAFNVRDVVTWEDANFGRRFNPKLVWQAPEVHARRIIMNHVEIQKGIEIIKGFNPEYSKLEFQFPTRKSAVTALTGLLTEFKGSDAAFVRTFCKRFDSWRIGLCMWLLWDDLLHWGAFRSTQLYGERHTIRKVLGGLTDFDPRTRLTVNEALRILDPQNRMSML